MTTQPVRTRQPGCPSPRKRAVFHNAVRYAVELRLLDANPVDRIQSKAPAVAQTVDRPRQQGRAAPPERGGAPGTQGRCRGSPRRRQRAP
jgi:hypothetical protein